MAKRRSIKYILILLLCGLLGIILYRSFFAPAKQTAPAPAESVSPPTVTLAPLSYHDSSVTVTTYATTVSATTVAIKPKLSGTIAAIHFVPGQVVKAGQLLFEIQSSDTNNTLRALYSKMITSKAQYQRDQMLIKRLQGSVAQVDMDKDKLQYLQDQEAYHQLQQDLQLRAPVSGVISDTDIAVGSSVDASTALATVVDPHSLQLKYQLTSQYMNQARVGQSLIFYANGTGQHYHGHVSYVSPLLDPSSYNLTLRAQLDQPGALRPNVFGKVVQTLRPHISVLAVSQDKVYTDSLGFYVYTVDGKKVSKHYFQPGLVMKNGMIPIVSGIAAHTPIISSDTSQLSMGQVVRVVSK